MTNIDITVLPVYQERLLDYSARYDVYYGGSGSGKSYFITQKILLKALTNKRKVLIIRKVGATLKDSVWQLFLDVLSEVGLLPLCAVNKSDFRIELPTGSLLLFKGLDDPEKIKSIAGLTDVWIEEATECTLDDFTQLDLRVRSKKATNQQIFLSYNPCSKANWCYSRFHESELPPNTVLTWTTYKDNPMLPESYIETLESMINTNPTYYRIYTLGEFCSLGRLVYPNYTIQKREPIGQICIGLDFGYATDPSALIVSYVDDETKTLYIDREYVKRGMTNPDIYALCEHENLTKEVIVADSAEPKSIAELNKLGLYRLKPSTKGPGSIEQGIQKVQQYKIYVNPECVETITELENYEYKKDRMTGEYLNEPVDRFNHCLDALRYSLQTLDAGRLRTMNKKLLSL